MIKHIVLFKFKEGVMYDDPRFLEAEQILTKLDTIIPELKSWFVGRNVSKRAIACDFALILDVENESDLQTYINNPNHQLGVRILTQISTWTIADIAY